jgi:hypothetical protein
MDAASAADTPDACQGAVFALRFRGTSLAQDRPTGSLAYTGSGTDVLVATGLTMVLVGTAVTRRARSRHLQ